LSCSDLFSNPLILMAARRRQLRSLGYAPYEVCLRRRGQSPVIALILADLRREVSLPSTAPRLSGSR
jgi:hypothetical protein